MSTFLESGYDIMQFLLLLVAARVAGLPGVLVAQVVKWFNSKATHRRAAHLRPMSPLNASGPRRTGVLAGAPSRPALQK